MTVYDHEITTEALELAWNYDTCVHDLIRMAKDHGLTLQETIDEMLYYDATLWTHPVESQWNEVE